MKADMNLEGKRILAGGAKGIGCECALAYTGAGVRLAILDIDQPVAEELLNECEGDGHLIFKCSADSPKDIESAVSETLKNFNGLDEIHALDYCPEGNVIADVATFLLSDAARFVTARLMPVSGGAELGYRKV